VATVLWTTDQIIRRLAPEGSRSEWRDASGVVQLCEVHLHHDWFGQPVSLIEKSTKARVAFVTRLGEGMIPTENTVLQEGDLVHVMVTDDEISSVEATLAKSPEEA
jgi:trk system potassium uptake protein TrkA